MNAQTQSLTLTGPAGPIEAVLDLPEAVLFEAPHGTPVIDLKPYFASIDAFPDATRPGS